MTGILNRIFKNKGSFRIIIHTTTLKVVINSFIIKDNAKTTENKNTEIKYFTYNPKALEKIF